MMIIKSCLFQLVFLLILTDAKPTKKNANKVQTHADALKYLIKYGYNQPGGSVSENSNGTAPARQSNIPMTMIKHFQSVHQLPMSGKIDNVTNQLMKKPRCSLEDYPIACFAARPWPNTTLKWKLHNELPKLGKIKTRQQIQQAFDDWARFTSLTFREANEKEKADLNISFLVGEHGDRFPFDGPHGDLAHGFFPKDGRIHFDASENWTDKYDGSGYNLRLVSAHAIGHILGLPHSQDPKSLMYPFYHVSEPDHIISTDDVIGIRALYGRDKGKLFSSHQPKTTTGSSAAIAQPIIGHDRCARFLGVVFGGGPDKWLYTVDHELVWRFHPDYDKWDTEGLPITEVFPGAEPHITAGILSPKTQKIYLFKGYYVWRFSNSNQLDKGFPKLVFGTGTPYNPIAALYDQGYIWLLKSGLFFKFDETNLRFDFNQPPHRIDEQFPGVPKDVRSAFTYDGKHHFFTQSDRKVYVFNAKTRRLQTGYPKPMATGWFACKQH